MLAQTSVICGARHDYLHRNGGCHGLNVRGGPSLNIRADRTDTNNIEGPARISFAAERKLRAAAHNILAPHTRGLVG